MKAALNGAVNFSVLDGWWREGYNGKNGWSIGTEKEYTDPNQQDEDDSRSIYETLEKEIVPLFYERASDKIPVEWLKVVKESMRTLIPQFSLRRMLKEYVTDYYMPAIEEKRVKK